jgi:hypothetical protein
VNMLRDTVAVHRADAGEGLQNQHV